MNNKELSEKLISGIRKVNEDTDEPFSSKEEINAALDEIADKIDEVIELAESLSARAENTPDIIPEKGAFICQLDRYFIPHMENWKYSDNQPGSIESLKNILNQEVAECNK